MAELFWENVEILLAERQMTWADLTRKMFAFLSDFDELPSKKSLSSGSFYTTLSNKDSTDRLCDVVATLVAYNITSH